MRRRSCYPRAEEAPIRSALPSATARAALLLSLALSLGACSRGRDPGTAACTPGEALLVGCASACGVGACSGDPVLRVCEGSVDVDGCADAIGILGESDDSCETLCPSTRVVCPASGRITVVHRAFREGDYVCDWSVAPAPAASSLSVREDAGRTR